MGNFTIFRMFENPRRDREARNFTTNVPKILDLKSFSEPVDIFRKLTLGAPDNVNLSMSKEICLTHNHCLHSAKETLRQKK